MFLSHYIPKALQNVSPFKHICDQIAWPFIINYLEKNNPSHQNNELSWTVDQFESLAIV